MTQNKRVKAQRQVVIEQLKVNSSETIFELLSDILSIEREHREHKHGVREAIKSALDRVADHDVSDEVSEIATEPSFPNETGELVSEPDAPDGTGELVADPGLPDDDGEAN